MLNEALPRRSTRDRRGPRTTSARCSSWPPFASAAARTASDRLPTAAPLAFAILDRARAGGDCLPQLNLAFLLSTHERPLDAETAAELGKAARSCPDDPTPLWLLGQFQSQRALLLIDVEDPDVRASAQAELRRALATFHRLERRFPGSAAGWSGEADAELRAAYQLVERQPFSARSRFRHALTLYQQARVPTRTPRSPRARPAPTRASACTARRCAPSGARWRAYLGLRRSRPG